MVLENYWVYMGSSMTVRPLAGYHCTCALMNWSVLRHSRPGFVVVVPRASVVIAFAFVAYCDLVVTYNDGLL